MSSIDPREARREPSSKLRKELLLVEDGNDNRDERVSDDRFCLRPSSRRGRERSGWVVSLVLPQRSQCRAALRPLKVTRSGAWAVAAEKLEGEHETPERDALQPALEARAPGSICDEWRKEAESRHRELRESCFLHGPEYRSLAHPENSLVSLPRHPGCDDQLDVVENIQGIRLEKDDTSTGLNEPFHRHVRRP